MQTLPLKFLLAAVIVCLSGVTATINTIPSLEELRLDWLNKILHPAVSLLPAERAYFINLGKEPPKYGIRRECRTLSDEELNRLFRAFQRLFSTTVVPGGLTLYQILQTCHRPEVAPGAHYGPCFVPWHEIYLISLTRALQEYNSTVQPCYCDTSLDNYLPNFDDSCLWTPEFFGNRDGKVTSGFAAYMPAYPPDCKLYGTTLSRVKTNCAGLLYNETKLNTIYSYTSYNAMVTPYDSNFMEACHGQVHVCCGGHMSSPPCSPTDPFFWSHHCFIDYIHQTWRSKHTIQTGYWQTDYPNDPTVPAGHGANDPMSPFVETNISSPTILVCIDGQRDKHFVPNMYAYAPSPGNCTNHADCGGKALWCNNGRCAACVKSGGTMLTGWPNRACYITGCSSTANVKNVCTCVTG